MNLEKSWSGSLVIYFYGQILEAGKSDKRDIHATCHDPTSDKERSRGGVYAADTKIVKRFFDGKQEMTSTVSDNQ